MKSAFPLFFAGVLTALAYVSWRIWHILPFPLYGKWTFTLLYIASFFMLFAALSPALDKLPLWLSTVVYEVGTSSLQVLLYLFLTFVVLHLGRLLHLLPPSLLLNSVKGSVAVALWMVVLLGYGYVNYLHKVRVPLTVHTRKALPRPVKLVLISDLHLGYHNRRAELARWVGLINAEKPDAVLIAGDVVDRSLRPLFATGMAEEFRNIQAPIYASLGNHEYYGGEAGAERFFSKAGITLLRDSAAHVAHLDVAGRDDRSNPRRKPLATLLQSVSPHRFTLLLDHQPYHLEEAEHAGIDFQFSGHTHRGQVWPISWIVDRLYEKSWGSHSRNHTYYYISSGLGIWGGKFRIGTQSEYVALTIKPAPQEGFYSK